MLRMDFEFKWDRISAVECDATAICHSIRSRSLTLPTVAGVPIGGG